ncbi:MAG: glycosyltransferase [Planctomycetaceae bacterium]|nr:glycosyltransferase [Planctomycetaceae bacterium]
MDHSKLTAVEDSTTPRPSLDLTVAVTCFNEEEYIHTTLDNLVGALLDGDLQWEIVVLDDASKDRSVAVVEEYIRQHPDLAISLWVNEINQGFGYNYVQGAFVGRGEFYRVVCGDDCESKDTLSAIFSALGTADLIIPYAEGDDGRTWLRRRLSGLYTTLVNLLSGHRVRYYNGMILVRRFHVMRWHGNYRGFGLQADLLARLLDEGLTYREVGVRKRERKHRKSTALRLKNVLSVLHTFVDIAVRRVGHFLYPADARRNRRMLCRWSPAPTDHVTWVESAMGRAQMSLAPRPVDAEATAK